VAASFSLDCMLTPVRLELDRTDTSQVKAR
jgi:hypothetical protein